MTENSPPDVKVTTVRLPVNLHEKIDSARRDDHRSFNAEVIVLLAEALTARQRARADR